MAALHSNWDSTRIFLLADPKGVALSTRPCPNNRPALSARLTKCGKDAAGLEGIAGFTEGEGAQLFS
jgi:hypothetical protein